MKLRKIITMGLAAIMAVSAMSISAFAANIPMRSEVDTKAASADNPVTYRTEDGIKITIYDPNISLDFAEKEEPEIALANASGRVYIPNIQTGVGNKTNSFSADGNSIVKFGLSIWEGGPKYNVALYNSKNVCLAVAEDVPKSSEGTLDGTGSDGDYYFRVSTYYTAGNASYYAYTISKEYNSLWSMLVKSILHFN